MISHGYGNSGLLGLDEAAFFLDVALLMLIGFPATIVYLLWRIFVTNRRPSQTSPLGLKLENNTLTECRWHGRRISGWKLALYAVMTVLTFDLGTLAFFPESWIRLYFW